jgi:hypothetical protein
MEFKFAIFIVSAVVLVPFVYGAPIIPRVCALPPDQGYSGSGTCGALTTNPSTGEVTRTCCWTEKEHVSGQILPNKVNYCQTCNTDGECKAKVKQLSPSDNIPEQEGGVLQQPKITPKSDGVLQQQLADKNLTLNKFSGKNLGQLQQLEPNNNFDTNNATQEQSQNTTNLARKDLSDEDMKDIVNRMKNSSKSLD